MATARTTRQTTPTTPLTRNQRSRQLALQRGLHAFSRAAQAIGVTFDPDTCAFQGAGWRIQSATDAATEYVVSYSAATDTCQCECLAAQHEQACWHAGLALLIADELRALYPARSAEALAAEAHRAQAHEDNARALGFSH